MRIALAMCRASRLDPGQPVGTLAERPILLSSAEEAGEAAHKPAWQLFRAEAERFVTRHMTSR